jgi:hypothetical protein
MKKAKKKSTTAAAARRRARHKGARRAEALDAPTSPGMTVKAFKERVATLSSAVTEHFKRLEDAREAVLNVSTVYANLSDETEGLTFSGTADLKAALASIKRCIDYGTQRLNEEFSNTLEAVKAIDEHFDAHIDLVKEHHILLPSFPKDVALRKSYEAWRAGRKKEPEGRGTKAKAKAEKPVTRAVPKPKAKAKKKAKK